MAKWKGKYAIYTHFDFVSSSVKRFTNELVESINGHACRILGVAGKTVSGRD